MIVLHCLGLSLTIYIVVYRLRRLVSTIDMYVVSLCKSSLLTVRQPLPFGGSPRWTAHRRTTCQPHFLCVPSFQHHDNLALTLSTDIFPRILCCLVKAISSSLPLSISGSDRRGQRMNHSKLTCDQLTMPLEEVCHLQAIDCQHRLLLDTTLRAYSSSVMPGPSDIIFVKTAPVGS